MDGEGREGGQKSEEGSEKGEREEATTDSSQVGGLVVASVHGGYVHLTCNMSFYHLSYYISSHFSSPLLCSSSPHIIYHHS